MAECLLIFVTECAAIDKIAFQTAFYIEFLEEASALYEQRIVLMADPEYSWLDLQRQEDRFEPHLDSLVIGGDLALEVCRERAVEGDFGELHAAIQVFCRQNRFDLLLDVLQNVSLDDDETRRALSDALHRECPDAQVGDLVALSGNTLAGLAPLLARLVGWRRLNGHMSLLRRLSTTDATSIDLIWAQGRLGDRDAIPKLLEICREGDPEIAGQAALGLLRMGNRDIVRHLHKLAATASWALIPLALSGSQDQVRHLLEIAREGGLPGPEGLLALGLLGDISAVELLILNMQDPDTSWLAAWGLNLITGADLYETVMVEDRDDEPGMVIGDDDDEDDESGEPSYYEMERICQTPAAWQQWWDENKERFKEDSCYRNGKLYSPQGLLDNLSGAYTPYLIRTLVQNEFLIRYKADIPLETDMPVASQLQALEDYKKWIEANQHKCPPGAWCFAGKPRNTWTDF